jgi:Fe-S cluster biogenesis protein NfuA
VPALRPDRGPGRRYIESFVRRFPRSDLVCRQKGLPEQTFDGRQESLPGVVARLFEVPGVAKVTLGAEFVAVQKEGEAEWRELEERVRSVIVTEGAAEPVLEQEETIETVEDRIREVLDARCRPGIQEDGGDVIFLRFDDLDGVATVEMKGACVGCPQSTQTLKGMVEKTIKFFVPEVRAVEAETCIDAVEQDPTSRRHRHIGEPDPDFRLSDMHIVAMFDGLRPNEKMLRRVRFSSKMEITAKEVATLEHVYLTCEECSAVRTIEALDSLLDENDRIGIVICPSCAVVLKKV